MKTNQMGIHWFRRDLRLVGNPALEKHLKIREGRVLGVFCFDKKFLSRPDFSAPRFYFFLRTLEHLRKEMRDAGGDLLFLDTGPEESFRKLFAQMENEKWGRPVSISWNRDYEPYARTRDARMHEIFEREFELTTRTERDHLLIEPTELTKDEKGGTYQVYTPFSRKWLKLFQTPEIENRMDAVSRGLKSGVPEFHAKWPKTFTGEDILANYLEKTADQLTPKFIEHLPETGHEAAVALLKDFEKHHADAYDVARDIPSVPGTSKMSIYLKHGAISVPQIICLLKLTPDSKHLKYFKELIWREFYYHILYHHPRVETEAFLLKYESLEWENSRKNFKLWCEGKTGYPIVDAGMRQLNETGWMHNRVRMIVASFLTKDLLIDYRWGEKYFMEKLLDGDLAPNNGGWQWAASTGCDPQPYFRIFNPVSQSEKFDPRGEYIQKWVPELRGKFTHEPINPIVVHSVQRDKCLAMFKRARAN
ncbi:MAG: deoxyribodipyrimidine photo-lyase [Cryobacterium sp.]|nr:deoxyribodipyrimidine photo-lyase [Oligoflexia bacterium]